MQNDGIGASIAILSAVASNLGVNIQKRSHNVEKQKPFELQRSYTKRPLWWLGMILIILGAVGDFFALGFATQTIVASLGGGSTILANVGFASLWLKQQLYRTDIAGIILVTVGVIICAIASVEDQRYSIEDIYRLMRGPQFIVYVLMTAVFIAYLMHLIRRSRISTIQSTKPNRRGSVMPAEPLPSEPKKPCKMVSIDDIEDSTISVEEVSDSKSQTSKDSDFILLDARLPLYWAAISGTTGAQSVLLAKCNMEMVFASLDGNNQFNSIGTYLLIIAMIVTAVIQTHALNIATIHGDTMSVFPVFQAFWIGMSNINGIVFFQQTHLFTLSQWLLFPSALVLVMIGIYLISKHENSGQIPIQFSVPHQFSTRKSEIEFTQLSVQEDEVPENGKDSSSEITETGSKYELKSMHTINLDSL